MTVFRAIAVSGSLLSALLLCSLARAAAAENDTIQNLRSQCIELENGLKGDPNSDLFAAQYCLGFMSGIGVAQLNCLDAEYHGSFAIASSTIGQRIRAFLNWADAHPEHWQRKEAYAIAGLIEGLPCQK